ncbi:MAG: hypothetical protein JXR27_11725 [Paludibacteraceae bacterium]|nr:hypothetical protein [Paludibacteraceae bacterium]
MKQLILSAFLLFSVVIFAQDTTENSTELSLTNVELIESAVIVSADTVSNTYLPRTVVIQETDTEQEKRINDIEKRLTAYYAYNRRSQSLVFLGTGVAILGTVIGRNNQNVAAVMTIGGSILSVVGAVIQLDSYKFLDFKPKRNELKKMTYY